MGHCANSCCLLLAFLFRGQESGLPLVHTQCTALHNDAPMWRVSVIPPPSLSGALFSPRQLWHSHAPASLQAQGYVRGRTYQGMGEFPGVAVNPSQFLWFSHKSALNGYCAVYTNRRAAVSAVLPDVYSRKKRECSFYFLQQGCLQSHGCSVSDCMLHYPSALVCYH